MFKKICIFVVHGYANTMEHLIFKTQSINGLTEKQFFQLCTENRDLRFERNTNKDIIIMSPTGLETGNISGEIFRQLANWNVENKFGKTFDSSTGFILPNNAVRSPDAAWISKERFATIPDEEKKKFPNICPDFVIELMSPSDFFPGHNNKMLEWIDNGCRLAWLISPKDETVYIYRADGSTEKITGFDKKVSGENILPGFELQLSLLRD